MSFIVRNVVMGAEKVVSMKIYGVSEIGGG